MENTEIINFEISDYLDNPEVIREYLNTLLEEGDTEEILFALEQIAKSQGVSKIAEQTGLSRTSLYKALSPGAKAQFDTILRVIRAIGSNLTVGV